MLRPVRSLCGAVLVSVAGVATAQPDAKPGAAQLEQRAGQVVQDIVRDARFNGAVVLMRDGQVVFQQAAGLAQRDPDRAYTVDTPSDGASLAKTLTAALVHELVAQGKLGLDDRVRKHLPNYPYPRHTLRDLVSHRTGLPDYEFFDADFKPGQVRDTRDLLAVLARRKPPPGLAAGVKVEYSNLGFDLAGRVAERVTGQPLDTLFRERYFKPLGMTSAFARPARFADWPGLRTPGYRFKDGAWQPSDAFDGEGFIGASNVHASALDWARWGDAFARSRVMAPEPLAAGLREPMLDSGLADQLTRLSWYCDAPRQRCHYTGAYNGFFAQVYFDRARREVVAYVSNSSLPPWHCARLTRDLADALAGREPAPADASQPLVIAAKDRPRYAGRYTAPGLGEVVVSSREGRSFVRVGQGELASLHPASNSVLYAPTLDLWLAFSGEPGAASLHLRSIFLAVDARRAP